MNPSIKYTIEINKYPFSQSLNTLQFVMSASLISSETNDDICSSKEFGNTTSGDDSNYIKIQVDNHSVYGRFIKRAIIDSKVQSIENILLDSTMKPISNLHIQLKVLLVSQFHNIQIVLLLIQTFQSLLIKVILKICSNNSSPTKGQRSLVSSLVVLLS